MNIQPRFATAGVAVILLGLVGCAPATLSFSGSMTIPTKAFSLDGYEPDVAGDGCFADDDPDYPDIWEGTQVTLRDSSGATVGLTRLQTGGLLLGFDEALAGPTGQVADDYCVFPFEFVDVESDDEFFTVEVGKRGEVTFSREDLESLGANVSLG